MNQNCSRNNSFDYIKGVLIVLVVLGHAISLCYGVGNPTLWYNPVFNVIYTFHMPLFVFISGYFFTSSLKKSFVDVLVGKMKRLLIPAFLYSTIILFIAAFSISGITSVYIIYKVYWYLICVFLLSVFYYTFCKGNAYIKTVLIITYILCLIFYKHLPSCILKDCQLIRQTLIFGLGICFKLYSSQISGKLSRYSYLAMGGGIAVVALCRFNFGFNMLYYHPVIRIVDGIVCSLLVFVLLNTLYRKLFLFTYPMNCFIWFGKYSLSIYLIHIPLYKYIQYNDIAVPNNMITIFMSFITLLSVSVLITLLINRIPKQYQYIFGV